MSKLLPALLVLPFIGTSFAANSLVFDTTESIIGYEDGYEEKDVYVWDQSSVIAVGDIDNDGDLDLVSGNSGKLNKVFLNDGTGDFDKGTAIGVDMDYTQGLVLGDVDGDGDLDIIVSEPPRNSDYNYISNPTKLYLNNGVGGFSASIGIDSGPDNPSYLNKCELVDIDNDGDLDLISIRYNAIGVNINDGSGVFGAHNVIDAEENSNSFDFVSGDINNDGSIDFIVASYANFNGNRVFLNNGTGGFSTHYMENGNEEGEHTSSFALGDVDGDGDLDLVQGSVKGTDKIFYNNGNGDFSGGIGIGGIWSMTNSVALGDMDRDGDLDLVVGTGQTTSHQRLYLNDGFGNYNTAALDIETSREPGDSVRTVLLADMDNDGDLDVISRNSSSIRPATNKLNLNNLTNITLSASTHTNFFGWDYAKLTWSGAVNWVFVKVNGVDTLDIGLPSMTHASNFWYDGKTTYQVCEIPNPSVCSNIITVD